LEPRGAHGLWHKPDLGRQHDPGSDPVESLEGNDRRHPADVGEYNRCGCGLGDTLNKRGTDQHEVAWQPVGNHPAEEDDQRLDALPRGEHDSERCRRATVEHGKRERDPGQPVANRRDRRRGEQQPEIALLQRTRPLTKLRQHRGRVVGCG
jgi:hypothetical protein